MSIEIVRGTNQKPVSSEQLVTVLSNQTSLYGQLFVGYPIVGTTEGPFVIDALLVSKDTGITVVNLIEGTDTGQYESLQDDSINKLESKLRLHRNLMDRRQLRIPIHAISFAPAVNQLSELSSGDYPIANTDTLINTIQSFRWTAPQHGIYEATLSAIENVSTIRRSRSSRAVQLEDSRGAKLKRLEGSIATLDNMQGKAVIETVEGVQRIRGLAGSGKTIRAGSEGRIPSCSTP